MTVREEKTVREYALETPNATRVFERLKIDYCCGGGRPLGEACAAAGVEFEEVMRLLEEGANAPAVTPAEIQSGALATLIDYILDKHHTYTRDEMARITALAEKVCTKHAGNHPELAGVRSIFAGLCEELRPHMLKEEVILFPYIRQLEQAAQSGARPAPPPFGTAANPISVMLREHDAAGDILRELRAAAADYAAPTDACISFRTLYEALEAFEKDLHQHIHLENNVLFPRLLELEGAGA